MAVCEVSSQTAWPDFDEGLARVMHHIDAQFQALRGEFYSCLNVHTRSLRSVRELALTSTRETREINERLNKGGHVSF